MCTGFTYLKKTLELKFCIWCGIVWFASFDASAVCNKAYRAILTASATDKYTRIITEGAYRDGWKTGKMTECWFPPLSVSCLWDQAICAFIITAMIPLLFCVATRTCSAWPLLFLSAVWLTVPFWSWQQQNYQLLCSLAHNWIILYNSDKLNTTLSLLSVCRSVP